MHENAQKFEWKTPAKFPATTLSYFIVKIAWRLNDAFSESFELEADSVEGQSLLQKGEKTRSLISAHAQEKLS